MPRISCRRFGTLLIALTWSATAHGADPPLPAADAIPADAAQLRELVPDTLEVYPVNGYGAIETGAHRFCHTENGKPDCGTFRFVQVWRLQQGKWQVTRELSYGHQPAAQPGDHQHGEG